MQPRKWSLLLLSGLMLAIGGWTVLSAGSKPVIPRLQINRYPLANDAGQPRPFGVRTIRALGLRVAFTLDDNISTTGDGTFLMSVPEPDSVHCNSFLVDRPPHDSGYFEAQFRAVANYFDRISRGNLIIDLSGSAIEPAAGDPLTIARMAAYRPVDEPDSSDILLVRLAEDALNAALDRSIVLTGYDVVVLFHAGLGQDFEYPGLDPTPDDIPSAFIDAAMIEQALGTSTISLSDGSQFDVPLLLAPEGQNHIYYDIAADIFYGAEDLCDVQIGLTGTLTLLFGYFLGLPPLFDTVEGESGVGVFGLMDVGSNNGQGVLPAPPSAWTRIFMGWEQSVPLSGTVALSARHLPGGTIGRVDLSADEYLLIENRSNWIFPDVDMDSLRYRNGEEDELGFSYILPHYFDYLIDSAGVSYDSASQVLTEVRNYDLGLPGSGLLIWHIDESRFTPGYTGLNDNHAARAVSLLEADGAVDIGFPTTAIFADPTIGWRWDMWYGNNEAYFMSNPEWIDGNPEQYLTLSAETQPTSNLNNGAASAITIEHIGAADTVMNFTVHTAIEITRLPNGSVLMGYTGEQWISFRASSYYLGLDSLPFALAVGAMQSQSIIAEFDAADVTGAGSFWLVESSADGSFLVRHFQESGAVSDSIRGSGTLSEAYFDGGVIHLGFDALPLPVSGDTTLYQFYASSIQSDLRSSWGRIHSSNSIDEIVQYGPVSEAPQPLITDARLNIGPLSLADLDGDGRDEIIEVDTSGTGALIVIDAAGTVHDNFPVMGDFNGPALVANLLGDVLPEFVVPRGASIDIRTAGGELVQSLALRTAPDQIFLFQHADSGLGLANGDWIHWFHPGVTNLQWVRNHGRHSGNRTSLSSGTALVDFSEPWDDSRVYCYPNPAEDGYTNIRFFNGAASSAEIRIFNIEGLLIKEATVSNLATNDYNDWRWDIGSQPSGLYYAVVTVSGPSGTGSQMTKIAVVR